MALHRDFVCGLLVLALAAVYYWLAADIQASMLADSVGPDGLPRAYAFVLGGLGAILTLRSLPKRRIETAPRDPQARRRDWFEARRAIGMLAVGAFYLLSAQVAGYAISIALVILLAAVYQGARATPRLAATAGLGAVVLWFVFVWLLHIQQPSGLLAGSW